MRTKELLAKLHDLIHMGAVQPKQSSIFQYLADHVHLVRLANGQLINDTADFAEFFRELGDASRSVERPFPVGVGGRPLQGIFTIHDTCPDCGHIHQGDSECGEEIGGGRVCRCERRVPA